MARRGEPNMRSGSTATHCARGHKGEAGGQRPLPGWGGARTGQHDEKKTRRPAAREGRGLRGGSVRTGVKVRSIQLNLKPAVRHLLTCNFELLYFKTVMFHLYIITIDP